MSFALFALMQSIALAYGLVGGVFLAFSDFIMRSLSRTKGACGAETMQTINREVFRWVFMTLFLGLVPASLTIIVYAVTTFDGTGSKIIVLSGLIYLLGCFGVTVMFNVPMNTALGRIEPETSAAIEYWTGTYLPRWTFWNTVRTCACILSAALLMFGMLEVLWSQTPVS